MVRVTKQRTELERFEQWWATQDWDGAYGDVAWDAWKAAIGSLPSPPLNCDCLTCRVVRARFKDAWQT